MTSNIDFWNEGLCTFHPICVVLLLFNKTLWGNCALESTACTKNFKVDINLLSYMEGIAI